MAWMSDAAIRRQIAAANQRRWQFGDLSQYITQWQPYRGQQVVLCCRVSERTQDHNGNLADAENGLCQIAESHGVIVVDVVRYVGSGCDPIWLARAAAIAKQHGAILVAESANRFIRHPAYAGEGWLDNVAREVELDELRFCTDGVALGTARGTITRCVDQTRSKLQRSARGSADDAPARLVAVSEGRIVAGRFADAARRQQLCRHCHGA